MYGLGWCVSYGASRESLLGGLRLALIALSHTLKNKKNDGKNKMRFRIVSIVYLFTGCVIYNSTSNVTGSMSMFLPF